MSKILIAYYSRKGQNYVNGSIKNLAKGNTEVVAEFVQKAVGGDLFEIDTVKKIRRGLHGVYRGGPGGTSDKSTSRTQQVS